MAKVDDTKRWAKNQLFYMFRDKRDFGRASGLDQAGIESKFQKTCDEWAAHTGLTFTKKSEGNTDLLVGWGKLGRDDKGNLRGGNTDFKPEFHMNIINFSDDVEWTANIYNKNYADFFTVAMHELGHAIGMDHSSDPDAIMYPTTHPDQGLPIFQGLGTDDAVGARYLYLQPPLVRSPNPLANKIILLVNENPDYDIDYTIFVAGDKDMTINLGSGSIKRSELTYWIEKQDTFNEPRHYKVRFECNGQAHIRDEIPTQAQVSFFYSPDRKRGWSFIFDQRWGDHGER